MGNRASASFDVVIVGAGPGGSNAAAVALKRGLRVAQIDKCTFPRTKPCAGALTIKSCNSLQFELSPMLRSEFKQVEFNVWKTRVNRFAHYRSPLLRMVLRPEFDNWLVTENLKWQTFQFASGEPVTEITFDGVFHVKTPTRTFDCKHLVGADGAYSVVNRRFKIAEPKGFAVAVEVNLSRRQAKLATETPPCFDFGAVECGYGWVFPKDDHWSVGIYTLRGRKDLRQKLAEYIKAKHFIVEGNPLETFESHLFPYGGYRLSVPKMPVYVVGDAGGFGDPIIGEGIYYALESGRIAGEAISEAMCGRGTHQDYYRRLRKSVLADTFATYQLSKEFYRNMDKAITILENTLVWRPFVQGAAEGATFAQCIKKGGWLLAKSLLLRTLRYQRTGTSLAASFQGVFRGLRFMAEPLVKRVQRHLGMTL